MRIRFTYHSNAIEGNTPTMGETKAVWESNPTIGDRGPSHAIHYLEMLLTKDEAVDTLPELHNLLSARLMAPTPSHSTWHLWAQNKKAGKFPAIQI